MTELRYIEELNAEHCLSISDLNVVLENCRYNLVKPKGIKITKKLAQILFSQVGGRVTRLEKIGTISYCEMALFWDEWEQADDLMIENGIIYRRVRV